MQAQSDFESQLRNMPIDTETKMPQQAGFDPSSPAGVTGTAPECPLSGAACHTRCAWFNTQQGHCFLIDGVLALWDLEL